MTVNLGDGTGMGGHAEGDTLEAIENIRGSGYADTLTGDAAANRLDGRSGDDELDGGAGNDTLEGGPALTGYREAAARTGCPISSPAQASR